MTKLKLTNYIDLENAARGLADASTVRSIEVDALVDTGATMLALPADVVKALGLPTTGQRGIKLADGRRKSVPLVSSAKLELLGRSSVFNALVLPTGSTPLLGQIPLEELDLVVDPKSREVRVNPASPDEPLLYLLHAS